MYVTMTVAYFVWFNLIKKKTLKIIVCVVYKSRQTVSCDQVTYVTMKSNLEFSRKKCFYLTLQNANDYYQFNWFNSISFSIIINFTSYLRPRITRDRDDNDRPVPLGRQRPRKKFSITKKQKQNGYQFTYYITIASIIYEYIGSFLEALGIKERRSHVCMTVTRAADFFKHKKKLKNETRDNNI